jgi:serine/threonine protein phosphatase PrpC
VLISTVATLHDNSAHGEDRYLVRVLGDHALLDAVMDGVTRRRGGQASRMLMDVLAAAPLTSVDDIVAVLEDVNQRLYQIGWGRFLLTTVAAALYLDDKLYLVGAGDSPVFLIRSDACQRLSSGVGGVFIGACKQLVNLYRAEVTIEPGDRVVLATDGVTCNVTSSELVDIVRRTAAPDEAAEQVSTIIATRSAAGRLPEPLGGSFRDDDRTAIFRFFSAAGERASSLNLPLPRRPSRSA